MTTQMALTLGLLLFGGAVYALHTDKMRVETICRDSRLYMDGGVDAEIEGGGLSYHHATKLFKRVNGKDVFLSELPVTAESLSSTKVQTLTSGESLSLLIFKNQKQTPYGYPGHLDAKLINEKISVDLNCLAKNL